MPPARLLPDDVLWHEPGDDDYSGDYRGRDEVVALLETLIAVTGGTFRLLPEAFLNSAEHCAALIRWSAERKGRRSEGNEIAVYRFRGDEVAEVWFFVDGFDEAMHSAVFGHD